MNQYYTLYTSRHQYLIYAFKSTNHSLNNHYDYDLTISADGLLKNEALLESVQIKLNPGNKLLIEGVITKISDINKITVSSLLIYLSHNQLNQYYSHTSLLDVLKQTLKPSSNIEVIYDDRFSKVQIAQEIQSDCTNLDFLIYLSKKYNCYFYFKSNKLYFALGSMIQSKQTIIHLTGIIATINGYYYNLKQIKRVINNIPTAKLILHSNNPFISPGDRVKIETEPYNGDYLVDKKIVCYKYQSNFCNNLYLNEIPQNKNTNNHPTKSNACFIPVRITSMPKQDSDLYKVKMIDYNSCLNSPPLSIQTRNTPASIKRHVNFPIPPQTMAYAYFFDNTPWLFGCLVAKAKDVYLLQSSKQQQLGFSRDKNNLFIKSTNKFVSFKDDLITINSDKNINFKAGKNIHIDGSQLNYQLHQHRVTSHLDYKMTIKTGKYDLFTDRNIYQTALNDFKASSEQLIEISADRELSIITTNNCSINSPNNSLNFKALAKSCNLVSDTNINLHTLATHTIILRCGLCELRIQADNSIVFQALNIKTDI